MTLTPRAICSACLHAARAEIDRLLLEGASVRSVAVKYGLSKSSVHRHRRCPPAEETAALIEELRQRAAWRGPETLPNLRRARKEATGSASASPGKQEAEVLKGSPLPAQGEAPQGNPEAPTAAVEPLPEQAPAPVVVRVAAPAALPALPRRKRRGKVRTVDAVLEELSAILDRLWEMAEAHAGNPAAYLSCIRALGTPLELLLKAQLSRPDRGGVDRPIVVLRARPPLEVGGLVVAVMGALQPFLTGDGTLVAAAIRAGLEAWERGRLVRGDENGKGGDGGSTQGD